MLLQKDLLEPERTKYFKYITSISKNVYIDKLDILYTCNKHVHHKGRKEKVTTTRD